MKRCSQEMSLLCSDNSAIRNRSEHLCILVHRLNDWRADENSMIIIFGSRGLFDLRNVKIRLKRINLTTKGIPLDFDIHQSEQRLISADIFGKKDRARAGSPNGMALTKLFQWFH